MPYLPISDGQGNLLPGREVIDIISCAQLWPDNFGEGWSLIERAYAGDQSAASQLKGWHGQKVWTKSGVVGWNKERDNVPGGVGLAGAVLYNVLRLFQHRPELASLNRVFHLMATAPPTWWAVGLKETPSVGVIRRNWRKYKNVSHLIYAHDSYMEDTYYSRGGLPTRPLTRPQLKNILARAELLREAGENIQLPRNPKGQTILAPDMTWKVPRDVVLPDVVVRLHDVSEAALQILWKYTSDQT